MSESYQEPLVDVDAAADLQEASRQDEIERLTDTLGWSPSAVAPLAKLEETSAHRAHRWAEIASDKIRPMIDKTPQPPKVA